MKAGAGIAAADLCREDAIASPGCDAMLVAIRRIARAIDLHSRRLVRESGLSVPQLLVLQAVARSGAPSIGCVASEVSLSQATVTAVIDRLEAGGLLMRERSGSDRRMVHVRLTAEGRTRLAAAPAPMQEDFMRRFEALESWERHALLAAFERVATMLHADGLDASPILEVGDLAAPEPPVKT